MACKPMVGAYWLLATCVALVGCQTTPPRNPYPQNYTQRPGAANSGQATVSPQFAQPGSLNGPMTGSGTTGVGATNTGASSLGGVPTTTPSGSGTQFRSTAQPFTPSGSFTPMSGNGVSSGGTSGTTSGTAGSNFASPAFSPAAGGPSFNSPPIAPPPNPSAPPLP